MFLRTVVTVYLLVLIAQLAAGSNIKFCRAAQRIRKSFHFVHVFTLISLSPIVPITAQFSNTIANAKVDTIPLDLSKMAKASYRGHVKFEIVGLKKLIKASDWASIAKEVEYYQPLFIPDALANQFDKETAVSAERARKELASKFIFLRDAVMEETPNLEKTTDAYFSVERSFSDLIQ